MFEKIKVRYCRRFGHRWFHTLRDSGDGYRVCLRCPAISKMTLEEVKTVRAVHESDDWEDMGYFDGR